MKIPRDAQRHTSDALAAACALAMKFAHMGVGLDRVASIEQQLRSAGRLFSEGPVPSLGASYVATAPGDQSAASGAVLREAPGAAENLAQLPAGHRR